MQLQYNISLRGFSTMRLGGNAAYLTEVHDRHSLMEAVQWAADQNVPTLMIGAGSNIVWKDEGFPGLVLVNKILRYEDFNEDQANHYITIGAGENWDSVVRRTVDAGLTGIESLSFIPGTAGATPVQNVGAYGQEIANTLTTIEAYDTVERTFVTIPAVDCGFGYRSSRFKTTDRGRYYITAITLHLMQGNPAPPFHDTVALWLKEHQFTIVTAQAVRAAVIDIRMRKLPDPNHVANNGSFFGNPIVDSAVAAKLESDYEDTQTWPAGEGKVKISAAWLVEHAGFKDYHDPETGMATWPTQSLAFVNEHAQSTADLLKFKQKVMDAVKSKFGVDLVQEPELLP